MPHAQNAAALPAAAIPTSPLMLCDRLIALAQDAGRAGFAMTAGRLVRLAHAVFEEPATARAPS